jgi:hypothetical protein
MCWGEVGWDNYRWKIKEMKGEGWVLGFINVVLGRWERVWGFFVSFPK